MKTESPEGQGRGWALQQPASLTLGTPSPLARPLPTPWELPSLSPPRDGVPIFRTSPIFK